MSARKKPNTRLPELASLAEIKASPKESLAKLEGLRQHPGWPLLMALLEEQMRIACIALCSDKLTGLKDNIEYQRGMIAALPKLAVLLDTYIHQLTQDVAVEAAQSKMDDLSKPEHKE